MLPALLKMGSKLGSLNWLTIAKIGCIIALLASTNIVTWKIAQSEFNKERLANTQAQLQTEKMLSLNYQNDVQRMNESITTAMLRNKQLSERMQQLIKEHNNAPPLPTDCVIDDAGVQFITKARSDALQIPSSTDNTTTHPTIPTE